ncbi:hypothetical protein [Fictibacillus arsenicus]|nr:hypothetical protein [Fictibacillus arsenicus]
MISFLHISGILIMVAGMILAPLSVFMFAYRFSKGRPLTGFIGIYR